MPLDFPPNTVSPTIPVDGDVWTDSNFVVWTFTVADGWRRAPVAENTNDPYVFGEPTLDSMVVGVLPNNMLGKSNTIIGITAARALVSGEFNSVIGSQAGKNLATGSSNVMIGNDAGIDLVAANSNGNVLVGRYAQTGILGALNSVMLGITARGASDDNNNEIAIGAFAVGAGSDTATLGDPSTTLTILNGAVQVSAYTLTTLPTDLSAGRIIWVSDATGGGVHCASDGFGWNIIGTSTPVT